MSSSIRTVLVHGATGNQGMQHTLSFGSDLTRVTGSSVVRALSAAGFTIRAAVRDLASDKAKALAALPGVELVHIADLSDAAALTQATTGVDAVFAYSHRNPEFGDFAQGVAMAKASKAAGTVKLHIWSSLESIAKETNGELSHPIFDDKYKVNEHLASIGLPHTNLVLGGFFENLINFPGTAKYDAETETITIQFNYLKKDLKFPLVWVKKDVGNAVAIILKHPEDFTNTTIGLGDNHLTTVEVAEIVQRVSGKKTVATEDVEYGKAFGLAALSQFCNDTRFGYMKSFELPNKLLQARGFKAAPVEDFIKEDFLPFLKI